MIPFRCLLAGVFLLLGAVTPNEAGDDILKIFMKGWRGHGGTTNRDVDAKNVAILSYYVLQCEGKPYFFIAAVDHGYEDSGSGPFASGAFKLGENPSVTWSCETLDGKTGIVKIGSQKYKLDEGATFWVIRRNKKLHVFQRKVDAALLDKESESGSPFTLLKAVARSDKVLLEYAKEAKLRLD